jgi:hypothetical protein
MKKNHINLKRWLQASELEFYGDGICIDRNKV